MISSSVYCDYCGELVHPNEIGDDKLRKPRITGRAGLELKPHVGLGAGQADLHARCLADILDRAHQELMIELGLIGREPISTP